MSSSEILIIDAPEQARIFSQQVNAIEESLFNQELSASQRKGLFIQVKPALDTIMASLNATIEAYADESHTIYRMAMELRSRIETMLRRFANEHLALEAKSDECPHPFDDPLKLPQGFLDRREQGSAEPDVDIAKTPQPKSTFLIVNPQNNTVVSSLSATIAELLAYLQEHFSDVGYAPLVYAVKQVPIKTKIQTTYTL